MTRRVLLRCIFAGLLGVLLCSSLRADGAPAKPANACELNVMTFNIRYGTAGDGENRWANRKTLVFDVLRRHDPDVVGLQEALRFQIEQICDETAAYCPLGVGRDDGRTKGEYCAILYRADRLMLAEAGTFWLSETPKVSGSTSWGNAITRICTWGRFVHKTSGQAFYLFNVHLDHRSQPSREKSVVLVAQRMAIRTHPNPVIVTGDFNASEDNPAVLYLKGHAGFEGAPAGLSKTPTALIDTFRVLHPDATEVGTFNRFKGDRSGAKIDYVLTAPSIEVRRAEILHDNDDGRYPSDHFPVAARIRLP